MRTVRIALILWCISLIGIAAVILIAYQQPDDVSAQDFFRCEGQPCVLGITPYVTSTTHAIAIMQAAPQLSFSGITYDKAAEAYKQVQPFYRIDVYSNEVNTLVTQIGLSFPRTSALVAQNILAKFGDPCSVTVFKADLAIFTYPGMNVLFADEAFSRTGHLLLTARVQAITVFNNDVQSCSQVTFTGNVRHWQGFRRYASVGP